MSTDRVGIAVLVAKLDALYEAATPGPWYIDHAPWMGLRFGVLVSKDGYGEVILTGDPERRDQENCELAAALRNAWPKELRRIVVAAKEVEAADMDMKNATMLTHLQAQDRLIRAHQNLVAAVRGEA